jgi:hypothetical protein
VEKNQEIPGKVNIVNSLETLTRTALYSFLSSQKVLPDIKSWYICPV